MPHYSPINVPPYLRWQEELLALLAVTALALLLGCVRLDNTGFFGDEYNSLGEFAAPGLQPHSSVFFALMRAWGAVGGHDIVWLRLLTALLAAAVVPLLYALGRELGGGHVAGLGAALLAALSPWRIEQGQELRFYSYFTLCAALFLWALLRVRRAPRAPAWALLALASLAAATAHLLGTVFVLVGLLFGLGRAGPRVRWALLVALCAAALALALWPRLLPTELVATGYTTLAPYESRTHSADAGYAGPRGPSVGMLLKPAYAAYSYLLGTSLYPLDLWLSLPAATVMGVACVVGLLALRAPLRPLLVAWAALPVALVLLALDSLAAPGYVAPGAQHIAPVALALWLAIGGLAALPRWRALYGAALAVQIVGLGCYYAGDWSLNARKDVDMRAAAAAARNAGCGAGALLVADGRMADPAAFYAADCAQRDIHVALRNPIMLGAAHVGLWYSANTSDSAATVPLFQRQLAARGYTLRTRWLQGRVVVEGYERNASSLLPDGQIALPWSLPPPALAALRLPQPSMAVAGTTLLGSLVLTPDGGPVDLALPNAMLRGVTITSSTYGEDAGALSVGNVEVRFADGGVAMYDIAQGRETNSWDAEGCSVCRVALSWRKRLDKLGRSAYPEAWNDFTAHAFATKLRWGETRRVVAIRLRAAPSTAGQWWVWQVVPLKAEG